jgi:ABC-type lipoprotein export system ATPase subunit
MTALELTAGAKSVSLPGGRPLPVLTGVDLSVEPGETLAIQGASGSGKSTLLAVLGLLDSLTGGRYAVGGIDVAAISERRRARLRSTTFGFIYQRFCLISHLTAEENVEAPLLHGGVRRRERARRARDLLDQVGLTDRREHRPGQLSGGEQQRVAVARALVHRPSVVLADEPTGSLDQDTGTAVMRSLLDLAADDGVTLIVVTHDPAVAAVCGRVVRLDRGAVQGS